MGTHSRSGIPLQDFYTAADRGATATAELPGAYPFTRGRALPRNATAGWIHRELSGEGDPKRSNEQLKYLIGLGQMGVDVIGDSPTQSMLDADHPLVNHSVGTQGVSLCFLHDYVELFEGIPIDRISISNSAPAVFALCGLLGAADATGVPYTQLRGSVLHAPLYVADAAYDCGMPVALLSRLSVDTIEFCATHVPRFHAYLEDTYFFSESGLNGVEEMALGFVQMRHLIRALLKRGIGIDSFAPRIAILVNCSMDLFEEIAKIRATRRIFAKMMKEEFGAQDARSLSAAITCHTSGLTLTAQQPINNVVRGALQGLALALAGVQAMEISAFDEGFRTPSEEAHLVGIRTQQIISIETGVARVADPLGGSYYIEALTDQMEAAITKKVAAIEEEGDPIQLAQSGYFRRILNSASERHFRAVSSGSQRVVGVNCHAMPPAQDRLLRDIAERKIEPYRAHIERVRRLREQRDNAGVRQALRRVHADTKSRTVNVVPTVRDALAAGASVGEIAGAMRMAYGAPYDPHGMLQPDFEVHAHV